MTAAPTEMAIFVRTSWLTLVLDFATIVLEFPTRTMLENEIREELQTKIFGRQLFIFDSIDSTNTFAKSIASKTEEGALVITEEQTAGRGRLGRSWSTEREKNLTFSLILKPTIAPEYLGVLSLFACVAVVEAIRSKTQLVPHCKWPNDILVSGKKCCGILSESILTNGFPSSVIIGIGLNVNQENFSEELQPIATSLFLEAGKSLNRIELLSSLLVKLEHWYTFIRRNDYKRIIDTWQSYAPMMGTRITINNNGQRVEGIAHRLEDNGTLMLQSDDREYTCTAGDVILSHEKK